MPRKSLVRSTDNPDMNLDVYRGCKTTKQQRQHKKSNSYVSLLLVTGEAVGLLCIYNLFNPTALRRAKTLRSFGCSESIE